MYCKHCKKELSDDSIFCSQCGTKQNIESYINVTHEQKKIDHEIYIPNDHFYCSYCGKVKTRDKFSETGNEEYHQCKQCNSRDRVIWSLPITLAIIIFIVLAIIGFSLEAWEEKSICRETFDSISLCY